MSSRLLKPRCRLLAEGSFVKISGLFSNQNKSRTNFDNSTLAEKEENFESKLSYIPEPTLKTNLIIALPKGWLFPQLHGIFHCMGVRWGFQVKNRFFPSSDVMSASVLKNFQLKELHFEHPRDLTLREKPVLYLKTSLGTCICPNPGNSQPCKVTLALPKTSIVKTRKAKQWHHLLTYSCSKFDIAPGGVRCPIGGGNSTYASLDADFHD